MTVQAFLQTDTFDRLMKNPDTHAILRKAAADPRISALADPALYAGDERPGAVRAMNDPALYRAMSDPAL